MGSHESERPFDAVLEQRRAGLREKLGKILSPPASFLWEVGSGHGHFLTAYAAAHPEKTCIGIDLVGERIERAVRKRDRARLSNLHFLRAEARLFLQTLPPGVLISEVFVLFPDPWPKLRHHKHRVLQPEFLAALAAHAALDCRLYFRTDHRPYFEATAAVFRVSALWKLVDSPWPFEFETVFQQRAAGHDSLVARLHAPQS
jgi:tRNA (guanine-N7-)-methyltransferase